MKDGKYSNNVQNCVNSDLFGSNFTHEQNDQDTVHRSRSCNESNMTCDFPAQYITQSTTLTNYCLCTCCHKTENEKMPTNSVASQIRLTSHKTQQKCIHCNSVPTDKFLTFDKTRYGENSIVSQMIENDEQNIICNMWM